MHEEISNDIQIINKDKTEDDTAKKSDVVKNSIKLRRTRIPERKIVSMKSALVTLLKNSIGKDLARIAMPVSFFEPLSNLQRMTEQMKNSYLLDKAAQSTVEGEELLYIAAYLISSYANVKRVNKPFNPLLYETFEWDRSDDLGWRVVVEQTSHHPPACALHAESEIWEVNEDITLNSTLGGIFIVFFLGQVKLLKTNSH